MKRSSINPLPEFFDRYINLVDDIELITAMEKYSSNWLNAEKEKFIALKDSIYAPGKWTVKDILQHVIDNERIFCYRALRFARNDKTPLPGYDEQLFGQHANGFKRTIDDLLNEFALVRQASLALFKNFNEEILLHKGIANNKELSVLAAGFIIAGHPIHHLNVIKERYYPLLK
jgi:hypothetical protein